MNKKQKAAAAIFIAVFAVYLCLSNLIAAQFIAKEQRVDKVSDIAYTQNADDIAALEDNQYAADRMETVMFRGWAFRKNVSAESKSIRLVFKGNNNTYRTQEAVLTRSSEVGSALAEYKPDGQERFTVYMSTLPIKNGEYEMYIEMTVNNATSYIATGETFKKSGVNWYNTTVSKATEPQAATDNDKIITALVPITQEKGGLRLEGSAYLPMADSRNAEIYAALEFESGKELWYPLNVKNSLDSAEWAGDVRAVHSSFSTLLSTDDMEKGGIIFRFIIKRDGVCERSNIAEGFTIQ